MKKKTLVLLTCISMLIAPLRGFGDQSNQPKVTHLNCSGAATESFNGQTLPEFQRNENFSVTVKESIRFIEISLEGGIDGELMYPAVPDNYPEPGNKHEAQNSSSEFIWHIRTVDLVFSKRLGAMALTTQDVTINRSNGKISFTSLNETSTGRSPGRYALEVSGSCQRASDRLF